MRRAQNALCRVYQRSYLRSPRPGGTRRTLDNVSKAHIFGRQFHSSGRKPKRWLPNGEAVLGQHCPLLPTAMALPPHPNPKKQKESKMRGKHSSARACGARSAHDVEDVLWTTVHQSDTKSRKVVGDTPPLSNNGVRVTATACMSSARAVVGGGGGTLCLAGFGQTRQTCTLPHPTHRGRGQYSFVGVRCAVAVPCAVVLRGAANALGKCRAATEQHPLDTYPR